MLLTASIKKKTENERRMRISSAYIFSKSFGGKIKPGQTDVNKESTFTKNDITSIAKEPKSYLTS